MRKLLLIAVAGAAAELIDGTLGMGFGVTASTVLIVLAGLGPAQASAIVHTAELVPPSPRECPTGNLATLIGAWCFALVYPARPVRFLVPPCSATCPRL